MPRVVGADLAVRIGDHAVPVVAAKELQAPPLDPFHLRTVTGQRPPHGHRAPTPPVPATGPLTFAAAPPPPSLARYCARENSKSNSAKARSPEPAGGQPRAPAMPAPLTAASPWPRPARHFRPPPPLPPVRPITAAQAARPFRRARWRHRGATRSRLSLRPVQLRGNRTHPRAPSFRTRHRCKGWARPRLGRRGAASGGGPCSPAPELGGGRGFA